MHARRATALAITALALLGILATFANSALATPSDPTLSVSALSAMLAGSPAGISGYFKTVDSGSTIETIPVTVLAVTGAEASSTALILFEATGPQIDKFGGIVAGMSGSPVYVNDGGTDKVVGAVSYGDYFTKGGTGLATPIDSMVSIRDAYAPAFATLDHPVVTTDGVVKDVVVSSHPQDFSAAAGQGAFVGAPLSSMFIGGLDPSSLGYKLLAKHLAERGLTTVQLAAPLAGAPSIGDQSFSAPLVPGAAVAALESRGDLWMGGVGTVTYTDGNDLLAFGHPAYFNGPTSLYLSNAWIDGVWPSTYEPYKLARVGAVRGTFTQDRSAGILGAVGPGPAETTFTATVRDDDRGVGAGSAAYMPSALVDSGTIDPITCAMALYPAGERVEDAQATAGSADETTTVVATDGETTYTITIPNAVDDGGDVVLTLLQDAANAINQLQAIPTDGTHAMHVVSVDVQAHYTRGRRWAKLVAVKPPGGLHAGPNHVELQMIAYAHAATQTVPATLTVPAGVNLTGNIIAFSQSATYQDSSSSTFFGFGIMGASGSGITIFPPAWPNRSSLGDVADALDHQPPNNVATIEYVPQSDSQDFDPTAIADGSFPDPSSVAASSSVTTPWVLSSAARIVPSQIVASAMPSTVAFGGFTELTANLTGPSSPSTISVYETSFGGTEQYVGDFPTEMGDDSGTTADIPIEAPIFSNTVFRLHYAGGSVYSAADTTLTVGVRAAVALTASSTSVRRGRSVTLKATVAPGATVGGTVVFELNDHGSHWKSIGSRTLALVGGRPGASIAYKPIAGSHKVRVRFLGSPSNAPSASRAVKITAK